jgi:DNA-binding transcriptional LysR family regulator
MAIQLRYLRHFAAAMEKGSMGKAARSLNISQPALTRSIQMLEETLKVPLFERGTKGITPTLYGINFYSRAKSILADTERAELEILEMRGATESVVVIGALPSQANFVLPDATIRFLAANDQARVRVIQKSRLEILTALLKGEFDFIFSILDQVGAVQAEINAHPNFPEVAHRMLFYDRPSVIVRADHPALDKGNNVFEELLNYPWVTPRPSAEHRIYINKIFSDAGLDLPKVSVECQTTPYLKSLVLESDFVGMSPTNFISVEESAGLMCSVDLPGMENTIPFGIQYRTDRPLSGGAQSMLDEVENTCRSLKKSLAGRLNFAI